MTNKEISKDRIEFIYKLTELKESFRGLEYLKENAKGEFDHPYKHFAALCNYLALTCFDILGQPADWIDFGNWLNSKNNSHKEQKIVIFKKYENLKDEEKIAAIFRDYQDIYGVKNSFYKFIDEIISTENKKKLLDSITLQRTTIPGKTNPDGTHTPDTGEYVDLSDNDKKKFLFNARNFFTHKGISIGNAAGGIFPTDDFFINNGEIFYLRVPIFFEKKNGSEQNYGVSNWPNLLLEIIEDVIQK